MNDIDDKQALKNAEASEHQQRIQFYEQWVPKDEASSAVAAFVPVIDSRLSNLKWMSAVSGALLLIVMSVIVEAKGSELTGFEFLSGLMFAAMLFAVSAVIFGASYVRVTAIKMELHNYEFGIRISTLFNQNRSYVENQIRSHFDRANRMDGLVALDLMLFSGGILVSLFIYFCTFLLRIHSLLGGARGGDKV